MKKLSLHFLKGWFLPIFLGITIGVASFVIASSLQVRSAPSPLTEVKTSINTEAIELAPVESTAQENTIATTTATTPLSAKDQNYFAKVMTQYRLDKVYELGDTVWIGIREGSGADDPLSKTLRVWKLKKSETEPTLIREFFASVCGSVEWKYLRDVNEILVKDISSPCEAFTSTLLYIYDKDGQEKLKAEQRTNSSEIGFYVEGSGARYGVAMNFDKDCSNFPYVEPNESEENVSSVNFTGFTLSYKTRSLDEKNITFPKPIKVTCDVAYGGGYQDPGVPQLEYEKGILKFTLADNRTAQVNPKEFEKNFDIDYRDTGILYGLTVDGKK